MRKEATGKEKKIKRERKKEKGMFDDGETRCESDKDACVSSLDQGDLSRDRKRSPELPGNTGRRGMRYKCTPSKSFLLKRLYMFCHEKGNVSIVTF